MDRFIERWVLVMLRICHNLKSNMDRFIVFAPHNVESITGFKIQYG